MQKQEFETVKDIFSADELRDLGQQLARENQAIYDLERKKKEVNAELGADIKAANGRAESLTTRINNGFDTRAVEVIFAMDTPTEGMKTVIRTDLNTEVRVEPMTPDERQRELFPQ